MLHLVDMVLIMTVNPGFGGQRYIAAQERKIRQLRSLVLDRGLDIDIEVDGGIKPDTISAATAAGANVFVAGSAVFNDPEGPEHAIANLRGLAEAAPEATPLHTRVRHRGIVAVVAFACSSSEPTDPAAFCDALSDTSAASGSVSTVDLDEAESVEAAVGELEALALLAPVEIAPDMELLSEIYSEVLTVLGDTPPGSWEDALRSLQGRLDEASAPAEALDNYAGATCGIEFEGPPQPTPTPTPLDIED